MYKKLNNNILIMQYNTKQIFNIPLINNLILDYKHTIEHGINNDHNLYLIEGIKIIRSLDQNNDHNLLITQCFRRKYNYNNRVRPRGFLILCSTCKNIKNKCNCI